MRRRADGWLNATQILKVAGFDKPQRTRVLEREVQKGVHEKVQGGYGKYQGTWVPPESALALARQYEVEPQLRPIIDYRPSEDSPPLAPKHTVVGNNLLPPGFKQGRHRSPAEYSSTRTRSARHPSEESERYSGNGGSSEPSATPSPVASVTTLSRDGQEVEVVQPSPRKQRKQDSPEPDSFKNAMLEYFLTDTAQIPQLLIHPPPGLDVNVDIDDEGHTALHWASAMGRIRIVKLLLSAGADPFKVTTTGTTALMRAVSYANNYDIRKFAELYELLHRTTLNIDSYNRTVFHHIVDLAMTKGKIHAARYYMETALARLSDYPKELADIINFQDADGETALTMAARCRSKRLVKALLDHGADPHLKNNDGKSAEDYVVDDERFRSSPTIAARTLFRLGALDPRTQELPAVRRAGDEVFTEMTQRFDELLVCLDGELKYRERELFQAKGILAQLEKEVESTQKSIDELKNRDLQLLGGRKPQLETLQSEVIDITIRRSKTGMLQWLCEEDQWEKMVWASGRGLTRETIAFSPEAVVKGSTPDEDASDLMELCSDIPRSQVEQDEQCQKLRAEIEALSQQTDRLVNEYAHSLTESSDVGKIGNYRKLLTAAVPGISGPEIDAMLSQVLQTLEAV